MPKCRRKALFGHIRWELGDLLHALARQRERLIAGHVMPDDVHMMILMPPKDAVSQVIGYTAPFIGVQGR